MRGAFGLVGLLVTIGVIVAIMAVNHPADTIKRAEPAKQKAQQFAGYDSEGAPAKNSVTLSPETTVNGKLKYVLVEEIVAGGAYEKYYGLKRNDSIIAAGPMDLRDEDGEMAVELIHKAYQQQWPLTVMRGGKKIELPQATPATPAKTSSPRGTQSPLQKQLEAIPGVRQ
ncbi:MAG: hypothetical protein ACM359_03410 [Bacillota bacterium]